MGRSGWFRIARRAGRRDERGVFSADWLLVIAAVMGLGGLSAYLVEDYLESLTVERSAEQRDTATYLDDGRTLNAEHRAIRHAAATAAGIIDEAVSVEPGDPRFATWGDWTRYFDAKCRRLPLGYSHMDDFTVSSLFLPPLRDQNHPEFDDDPSGASDPLNATALSGADTTPYATDGSGGYKIDHPKQKTDPTVSALLLLSNRKKLAPGRSAPEIGLSTVDVVQRSLFRGAVAWCFLPRSISATLPDGKLDDNNLRLQAARSYARGVRGNAKNDNHKRPGDPDRPGTWQNWQDYWTERCLETLEIFSDLKGFTVKAKFTKPPLSRVDELIFDPNRGANRYKEPRTLSQAKATCKVESA